MTSMAKWFVAGAASLALASCGGGSGGSSGSGGGGNSGGGGSSGPTITNSGTVSVAEDNIGPVQLTTDVAGVSFRISGGADQSLFNQTGDIFEFNLPISFETPLDANGDNVYEVEIEASLNGQTDTQLFQITITDTKEGLDVQRVASGLGTLVAADQYGFNAVLVARADSSLAVYDVTQNTISELGTPFGLGTGMDAILAIGSVDDGTERRIVTAVDRNAGEIVLLYYRDGLNVAPMELEIIPFTDPGEIWVTISGGNIALGDNGSREAAWDTANNFGNVRFLRSDGGLDFFANGFHRPVMGPEFWIDQGERFDEANAPGSNNFGWGQFDGFEATGWTPPTPGAPVNPIFAMERGTGPLQSGGWVGAASSLFVATDLSDYVIFDADGQVFTYSAIYEQEWGISYERRDADFAPDVGSIDRPIFVGLLDDEPVGGTLEFPTIVDRDGEIFFVR